MRRACAAPVRKSPRFMKNRRALPQPACLDCPVSASPVHNRTPRLPTASRSNCGLKQVPPADSLLDLFLSLPGNYGSTARRHAIHLFESLISRPPARPAPNAPTTMIQPPPATSSHDPRTGHRIPSPHPPRQPPPHLAAAQSPSERQVHPTASSRYLRRPNINRKTPLPQPKVIPSTSPNHFGKNTWPSHQAATQDRCPKPVRTPGSPHSKQPIPPPSKHQQKNSPASAEGNALNHPGPFRERRR